MTFLNPVMLRARFHFLPALAVAMLALALAGCGNSYEWNQKVTVVVETPQGERSGSSVMHVTWSGGVPFIVGDARGGGYKLRGEAPAVDLGGGRYLFALLRGMEGLLHEVFVGGRGGMADARSSIAGATGRQDVPARLYPMLVTFANVSNPTSVRRVDHDDLAAAFGLGYSLKAITLEITKDPVTAGPLEKLLGWLGPHPEPKLGPATGGTTNIPFYRMVSHGDFIRR
ncbi:hypothetical protein [Ochrobactrum sp. BTU2]|uniref:hypothetical protein n=1 Tax=Ochrobactrum sp. BTU2 TaxID=2856166 RepID=UPI00211A8FF5|nr:hypothetical protein [Ochrobactrum sp. BTU2]MCQ9147740.1 hypothetical protein [Ochrobactrum sp. BTU2]